MKSSTADSEHTPHPFYSHLSQSSCVKRRLGHSSSATYGLHFQIDYASNTNPHSGSSYSLRVLKSLHEIFRASFSHPRVKTLPKQLTCVAKNSQQKHSRETCLLKTLSTTKNSFLQVTTVCGLPKQVQAQLGPFPTQEKHSPTSFLPLLPLQHNYRTVLKLPSATKLHYNVPTNNKNSRTRQRQASGQKHARHTKTASTIKGFLDLSQLLQNNCANNCANNRLFKTKKTIVGFFLGLPM